MNSIFTDESSDLLRAVINNSPTTSYVAKAVRNPDAGHVIDFQISFINEPFRKQFSQSNTKFQAVTLLSLFPQLSQTPLFAQYIQVVETGQSFQSEGYHPTPDGFDWFTISVSKYSDGIIVHLIATSAESQKLQYQTEQIRAILDASLSSIFYMKAIRDAQSGRIIDFLIELANKAVLRSNNLTPEEVIGQRLLEMFPGNRDNGFFDSYVRVAETGESEQMNQHYRDELGLEGWFEVSTVRHGLDSVVVTFMNITESKQIEHRLRESNASLEQFATVASHDLQEPLRKVQLFNTILLEKYGSSLGEGIDSLRKIQSTTERMQALIQDLLAYSRLSKADETAFKPQNLNQIIRDVLADLEMMVLEKKAVVEIDHLPTLKGNALQLRQLFQNLLSNGLKFSKSDQPPHIRVTCAKKGRTELPPDVRLPGLPGQSYWQISVADDGIGFNETYREKIFEAFERLHGRSSRYSGSGIGLAIVRRVMTNHNGVIIAHSHEGEGATFTLYFPATEFITQHVQDKGVDSL